MDWGMNSEREQIGRYKRNVTYYLYLMKYGNGNKFEFEAFRKRAGEFALRFPEIPPTIEIFTADDFLAIEKIFWQAIEAAYKAGKRLSAESLDPDREIESRVGMRAWYVANKVEDMTYWRFAWNTSLETLKESVTKSIKDDITAINEIPGIQKISADFLNRFTAKLFQCNNFDELEQMLEYVSASVWDLLEPVAESLYCELEKATNVEQQEIERKWPSDNPHEQRFPMAFWQFARELENVAQIVNSKAKVKNKKEKQKEISLNDVADFYDR